MAAKIVVGMAVYVLILWIAGRAPTAAGLMLTFPTLNGLALYFEGPAAAGRVARTMMLLPVINGVLCAIYIWVFLLAGDRFDARTLTLFCTTLVIALWIGSGRWIAGRKRAGLATGIEDRAQPRYALAASIVFLALAIGVTILSAGTELAVRVAGGGTAWTEIARVPQELWETAAHNRLKCSLFMIGLVVFIVLSSHPRVAPEVRGFMGGFPIVPFGGLVSITSTGEAGAAIQSLQQMAASVWASPIVPIWFILFFTRFIERVRAGPVQGFGLLCGWLASFVAIWGLSRLLIHIGLQG